MRLRRIVTVEKPVDKVFAYLADFTTTNEWDPGTVETVRITGDGAVGTEYLNTSKFAGRETQLTYVLQELVPNKRIALRGENKSVVAHDTMTLRATGTGTELTYTADFTFKGIARLAGPLMRPALVRLGNDARTGLSEALGRL